MPAIVIILLEVISKGLLVVRCLIIVRLVLSFFFDEMEGILLDFVVIVTEPFLCVADMICDRFGLDRFPIASYYISAVLLMFLGVITESLLPV